MRRIKKAKPQRVSSLGPSFFKPPIVEPETAARRQRQYEADTLEECKVLAYSTSDDVTLPNHAARLLVDLAEQNFSNRPLSSTAKYARELVIWRWRKWRQGQIDDGEPRKSATNKAVEGAMTQIEELAKTFGRRIILKEASVRDRLCRKLKGLPRLQDWFETP
jgi:hypothetical protein